LQGGQLAYGCKQAYLKKPGQKRDGLALGSPQDHIIQTTSNRKTIFTEIRLLTACEDSELQ
jgi:hypothetical protein